MSFHYRGFFVDRRLEVLLPFPLNAPCQPRHAVNSFFRKVLNLPHFYLISAEDSAE